MVAAANAALSSHEVKAEEPVLTLFDKAQILVRAFKPVYWQALIVVGALYFARCGGNVVWCECVCCALCKVGTSSQCTGEYSLLWASCVG